MITPLEVDYIKSHAYVPEHLTGYVVAISEGEPFLLKDYLYYGGKGHLIFVGYPLKKPFKENVLKEVLETALKRVKPEHVALIAPKISTLQKIYYRRECLIAIINLVYLT